MRTFRLGWEHFRIGAMYELQYRVNFFIQVIQSLTALGTGLVAIALVYSHTDSLAGWSRAELLAVMGIHIALGGIIASWIQPNMERLMRDVEEGTFDYVMVKPADSQVLVSVREVRVWRAVDVFVGLIVLGYASTRIQNAVGILEVFSFVATVAMGAIMIYCIWLVLSSLAFRFVRVDNVVELFGGVYQAGRWPVTIYPTWLQGTLTFLVPLAFAVTIPAEALSARRGTELVALTAAAMLVFLLVTRWFWQANIKRYSGASA